METGKQRKASRISQVKSTQYGDDMTERMTTTTTTTMTTTTRSLEMTMMMELDLPKAKTSTTTTTPATAAAMMSAAVSSATVQGPLIRSVLYPSAIITLPK